VGCCGATRKPFQALEEQRIRGNDAWKRRVLLNSIPAEFKEEAQKLSITELEEFYKRLGKPIELP
jgi:hypothetical protein